MFVGVILIACPLIFAVEPFYHLLGDDFLEVAQQDDFILTMEVNPAGIEILNAVLAIPQRTSKPMTAAALNERGSSSSMQLVSSRKMVVLNL